MAALKDMISRKDEEIGQMKDQKVEKQNSLSLRHSSSSPGPLSLSHGGIPTRSNHRKLLPDRIQTGASDLDNTSGDSDKISETASQQSFGDSAVPPQQTGESYILPLDVASCADSDDRASDVSDGYASGNTDTTPATESSKHGDVTEKMYVLILFLRLKK